MPYRSSEPKKIDQMLETIRQHRAFFFTGREAPFSSLRSFFSGFALCLEMIQQGDNAEELLIPDEFRPFVRQQLGLAQDNTLGWQQWLLMETDSEEAAFEKFFELWKAFSAPATASPKKKTSNPKTRNTNPPARKSPPPFKAPKVPKA